MGVVGCIARNLAEDYLIGEAIEAGAALLGPLLGASAVPPPPRKPTAAVVSTKQIKHTSFWAALAGAVAGAIAAAAISALFVAAVGATGGAALAVGVAACFVYGSVISDISSGVTDWIDGMFPAEDGPVMPACMTVTVGGLPAVRAGFDTVACVKHSTPPLVSHGSDTITIEGYPASRIDDKVACGATLKQGVDTVMMGGETVEMVPVASEFSGWQKAILVAVDFLIPPSNCLKQGLRKLPGTLLKGGKNLFKAGGKGLLNVSKSAGRYLAKQGKAAYSAVMAGIREGVQVASQGLKALRSQLSKLKGTLKSLWAGACGKCKPKRKASGSKNGEAKADVNATCKDPIDTSIGAVVDERVDLEIGQTLVFRLVRSYSSARTDAGTFGRGWRDSLDEHLRLAYGGDLVELVLADGELVRFDIAADVDVVFNPRAPHFTLERTARGFSVHDVRDDHTRHFEIDGARGRLVRVADPHDNRVDFEYAADGRLIGLRHSDGPQLRVHRDEADDGRFTMRIERVDGAPVELARYVREDGLLTAVESAAEYHFRYEYDDHGRLARWADRTRTWNAYTYDSAGRCIVTRGAGGLYVGAFEYDDTARITRARDSRGRVTEYRFNEERRLVERRGPLGAVDRWTYDRHGRQTSHTDPTGAAERYEHDAVSGMQIRRIDREGHVTEIVYDDDLRISAIVDPLGQAWRYERDDRGAVTRVVAPDGGSFRYAHDRGQLLSLTAPDGSRRTWTYDERRRLVESRDALGHATRYRYDDRDRLIESRDPQDHAEAYYYDPRERLVGLRHPDGHQARYEYDDEHNLVALTDENGHVHRAEYGPFDLQTATIDPEGRRYEFVYDPDHVLLREVRAPDGRRYRLERDAAGRVVEETDYAGATIRYVHDAAGRVRARINAVDQRTTYAHDRNGAVTEVAAEGAVTTFERDALGRLVRAENAACKLEWAYDEAGRLLRCVQDGEVIEYVYAAEERTVTRTVLPGVWDAVPHTTCHVHDAEGRLVRLELAGEALDIDRDPQGQPIELRCAAGFRLQQQHDQRGALTEQRVLAAGGVEVAARTYNYDASLKPTEIRDSVDGATRYRYDRSDRIVEARRRTPASESFRYGTTGLLAESSRGGRTTEFAYAENGRLGRVGDAELEFDDAGRLVARTIRRKGFRPARWEFIWDAVDQLAEVRTPDGETWRYTYDPLGRRIRKYNPGTRVSVHFLWDGDVLLREVHVASRGPGDDQQVVRITHWHHEPGSFRPLAREEAGRTYFVAPDHLGTPKEILEPDGTVAWRAQHSTWGALRSRDAAAFCPIRFQGQYEDVETGLHYNRFRYYDPESASYLSPDPIGLLGGLQPHAYVHNPVDWVDPLGLAGCNDPFVPDEYWQKHAPVQVTPGIKSTTTMKLSSDGVTWYKTVNYYDQFGRLKGRTDYTTHPNQKGLPHPDPHHHQRNTSYGDDSVDGYKFGNLPEWKKNPDNGAKFFPGVF